MDSGISVQCNLLESRQAFICLKRARVGKIKRLIKLSEKNTVHSWKYVRLRLESAL